MSTPKVIPTLDDSPKEPRIKPKRCPKCQRPNKPEAVNCGICGYNLDAPPPPAGAVKTPKGKGGAIGNILLLVPFILIAAAGGAIAYFGVDKALSMVSTIPGLGNIPGLKPAPPTPTKGKTPAKATPQDAQRKTLEALKADAGACYTQFNDLMELSKKKGVETNPNAVYAAYLTNVRQMNNTNTASAGCGGDMSKSDVVKIDLCDEASSLKTCLNTVMSMQRDRIAAAGYRLTANGIERIKTEPSK